MNEPVRHFLIGALIWLALALFFRLVRHTVRKEAKAAMAEAVTSHDDCFEQIMWGVQGEFAAIVLRDAAKRWESVENEAVLARMRATFRPGSDESIPAQWLRALGDEWLARERPSRG